MRKAIGFGSVGALLWHLVSSLGAPIAFPEENSPNFPNIVRKPRAADTVPSQQARASRRKELLINLEIKLK